MRPNWLSSSKAIISSHVTPLIIEMNIEKLKQIEADFFYRFPGGFDNPEMIAIRKKHKLDKMIETTQQVFVKRNFKLPDLVVENMVKIIIRSSLISVFEKPRFRDFAHSLSAESRQTLANGLRETLHGDEQHGFETMLAVLQAGKLGKWSLMTLIQAYYRPEVEVYVKPTTVKGIIETFDLAPLHYKPKPTWEFYEKYRAAINEMKTWVDPSLSRYNIAFSGFLMRGMQGNIY
jgi:hypothetical protein